MITAVMAPDLKAGDVYVSPEMKPFYKILTDARPATTRELELAGEEDYACVLVHVQWMPDGGRGIRLLPNDIELMVDRDS